MKSIVIDSKSILEKPKNVGNVKGFFKGISSGKPDVKNVLSAVSVSNQKNVLKKSNLVTIILKI